MTVYLRPRGLNQEDGFISHYKTRLNQTRKIRVLLALFCIGVMLGSYLYFSI